MLPSNNQLSPLCTLFLANRNWDFHWNEGGSSTNVCADDYMGPKAFSSPEAANIGKYLKETPNVVSYSKFIQRGHILHPRGLLRKNMSVGPN